MVLYLSLGLSNAEVGLLLASFYSGYFTSQIPGSLVAQKVGIKRCTLIGCILCGTANAMFMVTGSYAQAGCTWPLALSQFFAGVGQGICMPQLAAFGSRCHAKCVRACARRGLKK